GRFGESLFIAMEYVDGLDLAGLLKSCSQRGERLPLPAAFRIAIDLMYGLEFAHGHGIVHRDISPSNVLISRAGEVKLTDFGIARTVTGELARSAHRHRIMGKWRYMSPEQTRGEPLQTSSDLFAAAAVLYELFVGEKLFPGTEISEIVRNIHEMVIPSASAKRPGLPPALDEILRAALDREPERRPARAAEIHRALTEISYESSIVATPHEAAAAVVAALAGTRSNATARRRRPRVSIDDLIREQLSGADSAEERNTEVTGTAAEVNGERHTEETEADSPAALGQTDDYRPTTIVRTGVDADGVTVWSEDEDSAWTSMGGRRQLARGLKRRGLAVLISVAALFCAAWLTVGQPWQTGLATEGLNPLALPDASMEIAPRPPGFLTIVSTPPGAQVWLDGDETTSTTPTSVQVRPDQAHRVEIRLNGYRSVIREQLTVPAGETVSLDVSLQPLPASLSVVTQPAGVVVKLDGQPIGVTPLDRRELSPATRSQLSLSKGGYETHSATIALEPGQHVRIDRTLRPRRRAPARQPVRYGYINLHIEDSWADVYLDDKKIAQAPRKGIKLPEGRHRLRLKNPASNKERNLIVEVVADTYKLYSVRL
ncbi:MAG: serine/threonine-protein kinase, partial [Myxococcota bacterium]